MQQEIVEQMQRQDLRSMPERIAIFAGLLSGAGLAPDSSKAVLGLCCQHYATCLAMSPPGHNMALDSASCY